MFLDNFSPVKGDPGSRASAGLRGRRGRSGSPSPAAGLFKD